MLELEKIKMELLAEPAYSNLDIKIRVQEGFLHSSVRDVALEDKVDLVVMGTRGASGVSEFLIGSNTEKVIRTAPCPVLAIPQHINEFAPKTVLLPSTLKNDQLGGIPLPRQMGRYVPFSGKKKVLYLNNPSGLPTDGSAESQKNRLAEAAGLKKTDVIHTSTTFFEDSAILGAADQCNADMIVMATDDVRVCRTSCSEASRKIR